MKLSVFSSLLSGSLALGLFSSSFLSPVSAINMDCTLVVPPNPLTAQGLSTPYQLAGLNQATAGPCNQANTVQSSFVQGAVIDSVTGAIGIYNPLVIDAGTQPAAPTVVPTLNQFSVVGLWFGNNANSLTLIDNGGSLAAGNCVNGLTVNGKVDVFGEYAYCNAPAWFAVANQMIADGMLVVPPLGQYSIPATATTAAIPNLSCPSVRSFSVIDQDQSDNMVTSYLLTGTGQTAQDNAANRAALPTATVIVNASDNRLISIAIAGAIGCTAFTAPDLANPGGAPIPALPLNELQAARFQQAPVALVPANDPMVKLGMMTQNLDKVNLYRAGVNQHPEVDLNAINGVAYCTNFFQASPNFINSNKPLLNNPGSSPVPTAATTLFNFLAMRLDQSVAAGTLNCMGLLNIANAPFILTMDGNGVVTNAVLDPMFVQQFASALTAQQTASAVASAQAAAALSATQLAQLQQLQAQQAQIAALVAQTQVAAAAAQMQAAQAAAQQATATAAQASAAATAASAMAAQNPTGSSAAVMAAAQAAAAQVAATQPAVTATVTTAAAAPATATVTTAAAATTVTKAAAAPVPAANAKTFNIAAQQTSCYPQGAGINVQYQILPLATPKPGDNFVVTATVTNANGAPAVFTVPATFNGQVTAGANGVLTGTQETWVNQISGAINLAAAANPGVACANNKANVQITINSYVQNGAAQIVNQVVARANANSVDMQLESDDVESDSVSFAGPVASNEGFGWPSFGVGFGAAVGVGALAGVGMWAIRKQQQQPKDQFNRMAEQAL